MITFYSVITGAKDKPIKQDYPITVFTDAYNKFKDNRRNSRIQKIMPHKYFDSEFTVYIDANMKLLVSPQELVKKYMTGYDMAVFAHGVRDCIYDEAMTVAKLKLDDPEVIIEQAKYYEDHEFAKHKGLYQGGFMIRRNNERTQRFNEAWWADYCRFSRRDQLSLVPALDKSGVILNVIDGQWTEINGVAYIAGIIEMVGHKHLEGNWNQPR